MRKVLSILLIIITILSLSSCNKDVEIKEIKINETTTNEFKMSANQEEKLFCYKFHSDKEQFLFINNESYEFDNYAHRYKIHVLSRLPHKPLNEITRENLFAGIYDFDMACIDLFDGLSADSSYLEHSYNLKDNGLFRSFRAEKNRDYYIIYIAINYIEEDITCKYDLTLYNKDYCEVEAAIYDTSNVLSPDTNYKEYYKSNWENDFRLIKFTAPRSGKYVVNCKYENYDYRMGVAVDYSKDKPIAYSNDGILATHYLNYYSQTSGLTSFNVTLSENETVYFRIRPTDYLWSFNVSLSIKYSYE